MTISALLLAALMAVPAPVPDAQSRVMSAALPTRDGIAAAAGSGDVEAMLDMAGLVSGQPSSRTHTHDAEAQAWLERAAATGDGEALYQLSLALHDGVYGVRDRRRAAVLLKRAADTGNGGAIFRLDYAGVHGLTLPAKIPYPVPEGGVERLRWDDALRDRIDGRPVGKPVWREIHQLSLAGYGEHMTRWRLIFESEAIGYRGTPFYVALASSYLYGSGVAPDPVKAEYWFTQGEAGYGDGVAPDFLIEVAQDFEAGDFGPGRMADAKAWYGRAADRLRTRDDMGSAYQLGKLYADGKIDGGDTAAVPLYLKAAKAGHWNAQAALGWLYITGSGIDRNVAEGLRWFTLGADNNSDRLSNSSAGALVAPIQAALGQLYALGTDVPQDYAKACYWQRLALDNTPADPRRVDWTELRAQVRGRIADCRRHLMVRQQARVDAQVRAWHRAYDPKPAKAGVGRVRPKP